MTPRRWIAIVFAGFVWGAGLVDDAARLAAQAPARSAPASTPAAADAAPTPVPADPETGAPAPPADYSYAANGRRDPFVRTVGGGPVSAPPRIGARVPGLAGVLTAEVAVKGILESQGARLAMLRASDGRTYTVRAGDHLMDGVVRAITDEAVVILQEANDPVSRSKPREVRKPLHGSQEGQ